MAMSARALARRNELLKAAFPAKYPAAPVRPGKPDIDAAREIVRRALNAADNANHDGEQAVLIMAAALTLKGGS